MSRTVRFVDPGGAIIVHRLYDDRVVIARDFRTDGEVGREIHELEPGQSVLIPSAEGKMHLYDRDGETNLEDPEGFRLRFGPPASVRHVTSQEPVTREEALMFRRAADDMPPIDFDGAGSLAPVMAGQLYQWLIDRGAKVELVQAS